MHVAIQCLSWFVPGFGIMRVGGSLELFGKRVHKFRRFDQFPGGSWLVDN